MRYKIRLQMVEGSGFEGNGDEVQDKGFKWLKGVGDVAEGGVVRGWGE